MITRKRACRYAHLMLAIIIVLFNYYPTTVIETDALFIDGSRCDCVVKTLSGLIQGKMAKLSKTERVFLFLGIPYAAPPIDKAKFMGPLPHRGWNDTLDAAEFGPICPSSPFLAGPPCILWSNANPRIPFIQNVDCLTLNIFTPDLGNSRLPVLVFIHGGSYIAGAGAFLPGEKLAATGAVVVTLNYRLGAFGFLQGDNKKEVPGNMAIRDILMALRWVQQNVRAFGGNPERVCLVGHSAGAALVMAIMLYKDAEGLFQSVSLQSGSILAPWALQRDPKGPFKAIVRAVRCGAAKSPDTCLNARPLEPELIVTQSRKGATKFFEIDFAPTIDGEILVSEPKALIEAGAVTNVPVMISVTKDEASEILYRLSWHERVMHINQTLSSYHQRTLVKLLTENGRDFHHPEIIAEALKFHYFDSRPYQSAQTARDGYVRLLTDALFTAPAIETADLLSNNNFTVYFWVFDYHNNNDSLPPWTGSYHGLELKYQLGCPFAPKDNSYNRTIDRVLSNLLMQILVNFAKDGMPIGSNDLTHQIHWFPYNSARGNYLNISASLPHQSSHFKYSSVKLWNEHVTELDDYKPTYAPTTPPEQHADYMVLTFLVLGIALLFAALFFILLARMYCCYDEDEPDRDAQAMEKVEEILPRAPMQEPIQAPDPIYYGSEGMEMPPARPALKEVHDPVLPVA